jgi:hypothetical protein
MSRVVRTTVQERTDGVLTVTLTRGQVALLDLKHEHLVAGASWMAKWSPSTKTFYAYRTTWKAKKRGQVGLHQVVMEEELGRPLLAHEQVDHINHDTLDNRSCNLRLATAAQNAQNRRARVNYSGFRGVVWHGCTSRWLAIFKPGKQLVNIGTFDSVLEAAAAYDRAVLDAYGEFAITNYAPEAYGRKGVRPEPMIAVKKSTWERVRRRLEETKAVADGHYAHFDRQGTAGTHCPACIAANEDRDKTRALLAEIDKGGT